MKFNDTNENECDKDFKNKSKFLCRHNDYIRDIEIIQVYDRDKGTEVRYMLKYQGKYLYIDKNNGTDKADIKENTNLFTEYLGLKQLDMDMICRK